MTKRSSMRLPAAALAAALTAVLTAGALAGCASSSTTPAPTPSVTAGEPASKAPPADPVAAEVADRLAAMSTREKLASLLILHKPGTDAAALHAFMADTGAGGFIVMGDNVPGSADDLAATTAALTVDETLPPLVAIDQEGGIVARLAEDDLPAAEQLRDEDPPATRDAFAARAALLRQAGVDLNFGVVADVTGDPNSFIHDRVFGATPDAAAARVEQAVAGEHGVVDTTLKHFPGHGRSEADSHVSIPATDVGYDEWRSTDAVPFERGIAAGAEAVMFGHLAYTSVDGQPASLSPRWHEILRQDLGFDGLAVTDDMLMLQHTDLPEYQDPVENAIRAVAAGNDLLVYVLADDPSVSEVDPAALLDGLAAAVDSGRIPAETLDDAAGRVIGARIAAR